MSQFWLRRLFAKFSGNRLPRKSSSSKRVKPTGYRLGTQLECLEDRTVPARLTLPDGYGYLETLNTAQPTVDATKPTWVVIHGRNSSAANEGIQTLAQTIRSSRPNDQVVLLDWSDKAGNSLSASQDEHIQGVASRAASELSRVGLTKTNLNLVGHSWGSYVAAELAENPSFQVVNSLIAIDPGMDGLGAYDPEAITNGVREVDFQRNARRSWAFFESGGDPLGSSVTPPTAHEQFVVRNSGHSDTRSVVSDLISQTTSTSLGAPFRLDRLVNNTGFAKWTPDQFTSSGVRTGGPYDAVIEAGLDGTKAYRLRYVDSSNNTLVAETTPQAFVADYNGLRFESEGPIGTNAVRFGLVPAPNRSFTPLAKFSNGVTFANDTAGSFTGGGALSALVGSFSVPIIPSGNTKLTTSDIIGNDNNFDLNVPSISYDLAGLNLSIADVSLSYTPTDVLSISGTASVGLATQSLSASLGTREQPGLVFQDGELKSLSATLNTAKTVISLPGVTITPSNLKLEYLSTDSTYKISGGATATFVGQSIGVTLGKDNTPGLVIQNGQVTGLDMTIDTALTIGGLSFTTNPQNGLRFGYTRGNTSTDTTFTVTGGGTVAIGSQSVGVQFGGNGTTGLEIKNGTLTKFDLGITTDLNVGGLQLKTTNLGMSYAAPSQATQNQAEYTIRGKAEVTVADQQIGITLGDGNSPGIKIRNGQLQSLKAAVTTDLQLGGLEIQTDDLQVEYERSVSQNLVRITGEASVAFLGQSIAVQFGGDTNSRGLEFVGGELKSLDMSVTADFNLKGIAIGVDELAIVYDPHLKSLKMSGGISISTSDQGGQRTLNRVTANLGTRQEPGLVVVNGQLDYLKIGVDGGFTLFGITVTANDLEIEYDRSSNDWAFGGGVHVQLTKQIGGGITLPQRGLLIDADTGKVVLKGFSFSLDAKLGAFAINDLKVSYTEQKNTYSLAASGQVQFPGGFAISGNFEIVNGRLSEIGFDYNAGSSMGIPLGNSGLYLTRFGGNLDNLDNPSNIVVTASAGVTFGKKLSIAGQEFSLFEASGQIQVSKDFLRLSGNIKLLGGWLGEGSAMVDLNWASGIYSASVTNIPLFPGLGGLFTLSGSFTFTKIGDITIRATVDARVPDKIPVIGGLSLGQVGFYFQLRPNDSDKSNDYAAAWAKLPLLGTVGFKVDFNGDASFLNGAGVAALGQDERDYIDADKNYVYTTTFVISPYHDGVAVSSITATVTSSGLPAINSQSLGRLEVMRSHGLSGTSAGQFFALTSSPNSQNLPLVSANGNSRTVTYGDLSGETQLEPGEYLVVLRSPVRLTGDNKPTFDARFNFRRPTINLNSVTFDSAGTAQIGFTAKSYSIENSRDSNGQSGSRIRLFYDKTPDGSASNPNGYDGIEFADLSYLNWNNTPTTGYEWWGAFELASRPYSATPYHIYAVVDDGSGEVAYSNYSAPFVPPNPIPVVSGPTAVVVPSMSTPVALNGNNAIGLTAPVLEVHGELMDLQVSVNVGQIRAAWWSAPSNNLTFNRITFTQARALLAGLEFVPPAGFQGQARISIIATSQLNDETYIGRGTVLLTPPTADLAVQVQSNSSDVLPGDLVTLTVTVSSDPTPGAQNAANVRVAVSIPDGLLFVSATPTVGSFDARTRIWTVGNLGVGETRQLTLQVQAGSDGGWFLTPTATVLVPLGLTDFDNFDNVQSDEISVRSPILVNQLEDIVDGNDNMTSLREAIQLAAATPGRDLIRLVTAGEYRVGASLPITDAVKIEGTGAQFVGLRGTLPNTRVLEVTPSGSLELSKLRILGTGIRNQGGLAARDVEFDSNQNSGMGGAIENTANLTIERSTFVSNSADQGGAISSANTSSIVTIRNSTFTANSARFGGAIAVMNNSLQIDSSTIVGNQAALLSGGISLLAFGKVLVSNSVVANNTSADNGLNIFGLWDGMSLPNLVNNTDVKLGALAWNGGLTRTMLPFANSPVLDAGGVPTTSLDQRGLRRVVNGKADLGAVELPLGPATSYTVSNLPSGLVTDKAYSITIIARDANNRPADGGTITFTSTDPDAILPPTYTFRDGDNGSKELLVTFKRHGQVSLSLEGTRPTQNFVWTSGMLSVVANELVVTTSADVTDPNDQFLSLREAIELANLGIGLNTIRFNTTGPITLTGDTLQITDPLNIIGNQQVIVGSTARAFTISNTGSLSLQNLTLQVSSGIANFGVFALQNVTIQHVASPSPVGNGGALENWGTATIENSTLSGRARANGGTIYNAGQLTLRSSRINGGSASHGGGLYNAGQASISNTTFDANTATLGGAIYNTGTLNLDDSTITANFASQNAAGIYVDRGVAPITGTIVAANTILSSGIPMGFSRDVVGTVQSAGYNLIGVQDGSSGWNNLDFRGTRTNPLDPRLISNNLGWIPQPGSLAVDGNSPTDSSTFDMFGQPRRVGGRSDIGAIEVQPEFGTTLTLTRVGSTGPVTAGTTITYRVTFLDRYGHVAPNSAFSAAFSSSDPRATLPGVDDYERDAADNLIIRVTLVTAGMQTIQVRDVSNNNALLTSTTVTVNPDVTNRVVVTNTPTTITAGAVVPLTLIAYDRFGNIATQHRGNVDVTSTDPQFASTRISFTAATAGVVTVNIQLRTAGLHAVRFVDTTLQAHLSVVTPTITVKPAVFRGYAISWMPTTIRRGQAFDLVLRAIDEFGNTVTNYTGTMQLYSWDPLATFPSTVTMTASHRGTITIKGITLRTFGLQRIQFTDVNTKTSSTFSFNVR